MFRTTGDRHHRNRRRRLQGGRYNMRAVSGTTVPPRATKVTDPTTSKERTAKRSEVAARALVMAELRQIVEDGQASWHTLESGEIEMRFLNGALFHLGSTGIKRVA